MLADEFELVSIRTVTRSILSLFALLHMRHQSSHPASSFNDLSAKYRAVCNCSKQPLCLINLLNARDFSIDIDETQLIEFAG